MGFLDKLWDETLAGPKPNTGLDRLRKYNPFSTVQPPNHPTVTVVSGDDLTVQVSRSITILRPKRLSIDQSSGPSTPSTDPSSPFSPGMSNDPDRPDVKRFNRKKPSFDCMDHASPSSPTVYDWIMIGALDR